MRPFCSLYALAVAATLLAPSRAIAQNKPAKKAVPPALADTQPTPSAATAAAPGALRVTKGAVMQPVSGSGTAAVISPGVFVEPLARDRGWVKVRMEGWISEKDLAPADSSFRASLSAADLRADPEGTKGKIVRWEVQLLSLQYADPLRRDLAREEPYLLARGPGEENALLYLAIPPSMLKDIKSLPPLTNLLITARVRVGRSDPGGMPILDLRSYAKR